MSRNILTIVSSHGELGGEPNGTYAPELTHALHVLEREGIKYDLASPRGGPIPLYGEDADALTREMLSRPELAAQLRQTLRLADVELTAHASCFDARMRSASLLVSFALVLACEPGRLTRSDVPSFDGSISCPSGFNCPGPPDAGTETDPVDGGLVEEEPQPDLPLGPVEGLELTGFEIYQTIRVPIVENGSVVPRTIPLIANKPSLLRVFVRPTGDWSARLVTASVRIDTGSEVRTLMQSATISGASSVDTPASTLNLAVPGDVVTPSASISISLLEMGGAGSDLARFPRDGGELALDALQNGGIDVVVVPIRYDADDSGRMPDTSEDAMDALRDQLLAMWPVSEVRLRVREPISTRTDVAPTSGRGWTALLDEIGNIRQRDRGPGSEYYMGIFNPAPTFFEFCERGCIAGLAPVNVDNLPSFNFGISLGYADEDNRHTVVHELGHTHGLSHAPCGDVDGAERDFPHADGATGVWGYDFRSGASYDPLTPDFMGYCDPIWVSDFAYERLHERVVSVAGGSMLSWRRAPHHVFRVAPFAAPTWTRLVEERVAGATEGGLTMMKARDRLGRDLGWVGARRVDTSLPGFASLLVPDVEDAAFFETPSGQVLHVGESALHPHPPDDSNVH